MKKIFTLISGAVLLAGVAFGQTQRLVLFEEFTGETCGPCAQVNPGLNTMLNANEEKVVSIKYQNNIPSAGPRFWPYAQSDIQSRMTYYANNYSPNGILDGNVFNDNAGALDPTIINNRYVVSSPFTVVVSHTFSAANDSIYATVVITSPQGYTGTNLVAQVAVTERDIFGYTSPNGENHYEGVMRKMLPSPAGTALQSVWNSGDSYTINLSWAITPATLSSPVYSQLSVVAFVQENTTKEVLQAGFSRAQVPVDPKAKSLADVSNVVCNGSVTPTINVFNNGVTPLTSLDVLYNIDGAANQTYTWTGNLASFTPTSITLPASTVATPGSHYVSASLSNPNAGLVDNNLLNNTAKIYFGVPVAPVAGNVVQDFSLTTFPPANWMRVDQDGNNVGWSRSTTSNGGTGSAKMDFYNSPGGNIDNLYISPIDMTGATNADLTFDVAHRQYSADYNDMLNAEASSDCGLTWTNVWSKSGAQLATVAGYVTSAFTPTLTQWRAETASLSAFAGQSNVIVRFNAVSAYGNNAYVDNVNVTTTTGIKTILNENAVSINPSVTSGNILVKTSFDTPQNVTVKITDVLGREIKSISKNNISNDSFTIDLSAEANGAYFVNMIAGSETYSKKIVKE